MRLFFIATLFLFSSSMAMAAPEVKTTSQKEVKSMSQDQVIAKVAETLDGFHLAAAKADSDRYFGYFTADGIFIGTDAAERWTVAQFKAYAEPHFKKGKGWTYKARTRNIHVSEKQNFAWFDEILDSESYGTSRGTGVLQLIQGQWRIAQYHLTFPIPNDLAGKFTKEIKAYEKR